MSRNDFDDFGVPDTQFGSHSEIGQRERGLAAESATIATPGDLHRHQCVDIDFDFAGLTQQGPPPRSPVIL